MAFICPFACSMVAPGLSRAIIELNSLPRPLSLICAGVNENGAGITVPVGLIRDGAQLAVGGANRNFPGLEFTVDVPFRRANGVIVPAGQNLAPAFDIAGSVLDHRGSGHVVTTATWVAGGSFVVPAGKSSITVTTRVTDDAGKTGSVTRAFAISAVSDGQSLTPAP